MPSVILAGTTLGTSLSLTGDTSGELQIQTNNGSTTAMTLTTGGNVGIGTSSPSVRLHVVGGTNNPAIFASSDATNSFVAFRYNTSTTFGYVGNGSGVAGGSSGDMAIRSEANLVFASGGSTERMRITSGGNLLLGTTTDTARLTVQPSLVVDTGWKRCVVNGDPSYNLFLDTQWSTAQGVWQRIGQRFADVDSASIEFGPSTAGTIVFNTNSASTERMRITSAGNVSIGTTVSGGKLTVWDGNINVNWGGGYLSSIDRGITILAGGYNDTTNKARVVQIGGVGDNNNRCGWTSYSIKTNGVNNGAEYYIRPVTWTGTAFAEQASAGVYLTDNATSWSSASDERLKDIIEPIIDAANKVSTLRAVIGKYKTDEEGTRRSFLIAQDVQKVLPEAVNKQKDEIGTLSLAYTDVIPLLVKAIQELKAELDSVKAELQTLKGN
jgi:hypothetical protein